jgi:superfamily I DNA/RNA helicase
MPPFKFILPTTGQLTRSQRQAINEISAVTVTGVPGSGKTVVSIYRVLGNSNAELFTFTRMLKTSIAHSVMAKNILSSKRIHSVHAWFWDLTKEKLQTALKNNNLLTVLRNNHVHIDELIVDEAQDLPLDFYKSIKQVCNKVSIGADDAQQIYDKVDTCEKDLKNIFNSNAIVELGQNFRNRFEIFNFSRQFMPNNPRVNDPNILERLRMENSGGELPMVFINSSENSRKDFIMNILNNNKNKNIAILVPSQKAVDRYHSIFSNAGYECSKYHSSLTDEEKQYVENNLKNILVTTMHSSKGLEFDIVILPDIEEATIEKRKLYYVATTRAKDNLFLIGSNMPLILSAFNKQTFIPL